MTTSKRCLLWSWKKWIARTDVQHARHYEAKVRSDHGQYAAHGVEIVYRNGSFTLPADSEEEELWLTGEINDFVKSLN
ncbi:MAG: hypothetical protein QM775_23985 [Pirellulales bacterium]